MKYLVPLTCDSSKEPIALFSATTTEGQLVIIFSNMATWSRFADAVGPVLRTENRYLGSTPFEADSVDAVVDQLADLYPAVLDEATFIPDTAPVVESVITYFERLPR